MRIAVRVGVGVVGTVRRDPFDGAALQSQRADEGDGVLRGFPEREAAMGQQPVVTERDSETGDDVERDGDADGLP